jgi:hypothetical protein
MHTYPKPARRTLAAVGLAAALSAGATAALTSSAEAVPAAQRSCASNVIQTKASDGWTSTGLSATVRNGSKPRHVIAQLASDAGIDPDAEIRVGYSIDGGPVQEHTYGPANFANNTQYWETRSTLAVIPVPAGTHTVRPHWRISGAAAKGGVLASRCFTVEARTR